jgi:hypothetical protein
MYAYVNYPSSWQARRTDQNLCQIYSDCGLIANSAFPKLGAVCAGFLFPMKDDILQELSEEDQEVALLNSKISSLRQAADWVNGNLQSIFAKLQLPQAV